MVELVLAAALGATPTALTFEDAVHQALERHPALAVAGADVNRARALVEQARAPSLPTLSGSLGYTRLDAERTLSGRVVAGQDQLSGNVTLTVPLLNAGRWAQWYRADLSQQASAATADDVRRQVAVAAARAWLTVLAQRRVLDAATRARDTAKAHADFARDRRQGGVGTRIDELRATQELAVSEQAFATASLALTRAQDLLSVAVASDTRVDIASGEPAFEAPTVADAEAGVSGRRDVVAARVRSETAHAASRYDAADYLPLVTAVAQPFTQNPPSITQPLFGWQAQVVLTVPFYEGGARYGQQKERRAQAASADAQLEQALRQARSEVRSAFEAVQRADEALAAARASAKDAAEALELANTAWTAGASTNLEVIDAERRARDAQTQVAVAEDAARQARLDLLAVSGRFPGP